MGANAKYIFGVWDRWWCNNVISLFYLRRFFICRNLNIRSVCVQWGKLGENSIKPIDCSNKYNWIEQRIIATHTRTAIFKFHNFKKTQFFTFFYKTMQTWWVFYIFIYCLIIYLLLNMYFLLFSITSFGHQQIKIRNQNNSSILLISNKQGHTRIYTHTHTSFIFLSRSHPNWFI